MKINKPSLNKKTVIITISVILVATVGYGVYAIAAKQWPFATEPSASETSSLGTDTDTTPTDTSADSSKVDPSSPDTPVESPKTPVNNDNPAPEPENKVGVTFTSITSSSSNIRIKSLIEAVTNQGTCTLTFIKGSETVTKTSGIHALPHSSTCKGFTIPASELSSGVWRVKLSVTTAKKTGSVSQDYEVR